MIRICAAGFGCRGENLSELWTDFDDVEIVGVCDLYPDRAEAAADAIEKKTGRRPQTFTDYRPMLALKPDLFLVTTAWRDHIPLVLAGLEAGIYTACEVGGAYSVEQCWELVRTQERTGTPLAFLENCCYGRLELMALNMAEQGVFGTLVHCSGRYGHDLREEIAYGKKNRHYRLENYLHRNCENYPTHELGPIARLLKINRGNRMLTLTSVASKAAGMAAYAQEKNIAELQGKQFAQGDIVTTLIRCANGETIELCLDTTLPRAYSRSLTVRGTKGMLSEDNMSLFLDSENHAQYDCEWEKQYNNIVNYYERYDHPIWKKFLAEGVKGSHGGMDYLLFADLFDCVRQGKPFGIDVYDMASWMVITALSEQSIARGGTMESIPDFTCGKWIKGGV